MGGEKSEKPAFFTFFKQNHFVANLVSVGGIQVEIPLSILALDRITGSAPPRPTSSHTNQGPLYNGKVKGSFLERDSSLTLNKPVKTEHSTMKF